MNKIFTLITLGMVCLVFKPASAQFSNNFDVNGGFTSNCWSFEGFFMTTSTSEVITGTGSLYTNPPTNDNGSGTRDMVTPFLNITSTTINIAFNYKLSSTLNGQAVRAIEVGLLDVNDVFTSLDIITMNRNTPNLTITNIYDKTFTIPSTGVKRIMLKFSGSTGDGNTRMIVDDLYTDASPYYSLNGTNCNSAPVVQNDIYNAMAFTTFQGTSVLLNDGPEPDGENTTLSLVTPSPDGKVVLNEDGTFTFTPNEGFLGTSTTFTYSLTDNGYKPMQATATVTINFSQPILLPIKLTSFTGAISNNNVQLWWYADGNEAGSYFEVQESLDGKSFKSESVVFTTNKTGTANYGYEGTLQTGVVVYYRIKIINKDNSISYSKVIALKREQIKRETSLVVLQNPVQSTLAFNYTSTLEEQAEVAIYSLNGTKLFTKLIQVKKGTNHFSYPLDRIIMKGTYILAVQSFSTFNSTKFIKQ